MRIDLYSEQLAAIKKMHSGSVLAGGVGSGKSITSLYFYEANYFDLPLYIITTARKRDSMEWDKDMIKSLGSSVAVAIDSWNNIQKYVDVKNAFFIFDEQRVVGSGAWVKAFLKITKSNKWILLSATPGDTWMDYIPVFIANGFYKSRTEFIRTHVIFKPFRTYPIVDHYIDVKTLEKHREDILIPMDIERPYQKHEKIIYCDYNIELYKQVKKDHWDFIKNEPIEDAAGLCRMLRYIVNTDDSRLRQLEDLYSMHHRIIVFYNFNYELELIKDYFSEFPWDHNLREWNGHKHQPIPNTDTWIYLVQYMAGSEAWNCTDANTIIFYSQNHSYKLMTQAAGRIDRVDTKFKDLYYYYLRSNSSIDIAIANCLDNKKDFNENNFSDEN